MAKYPTVCTGFCVMATVLDEVGKGVIRTISRVFASEDAARSYVEAARSQYPDAYLHRIMKPERGRRAGPIA